MSSVPPPIRNTAPAQAIDLANQVDWIILKVDRLSTAYKILKWATMTAVVAGLTGVGAVISLVYSRGASDQALRDGIERANTQFVELRDDVREVQRELNKIVYGGRTPVVTPGVEDRK